MIAPKTLRLPELQGLFREQRWQGVCIRHLAGVEQERRNHPLTVEVRYRIPGQYDVLISRNDDDRYSSVTCIGAVAVGTAIRQAAGHVGWEQLRLPILVGGRRPPGAPAIPDDLKTVLVEIVRDRAAALLSPSADGSEVDSGSEAATALRAGREGD